MHTNGHGFCVRESVEGPWLDGSTQIRSENKSKSGRLAPSGFIWVHLWFCRTAGGAIAGWTLNQSFHSLITSASGGHSARAGILTAPQVVHR